MYVHFGAIDVVYYTITFVNYVKIPSICREYRPENSCIKGFHCVYMYDIYPIYVHDIYVICIHDIYSIYIPQLCILCRDFPPTQSLPIETDQSLKIFKL